MITLYGIPNCDQVKKARIWLDAHGIPYEFHDFKKTGITSALIETWLTHVDWEVLVNRKGTTWRALSDDRKALVRDAISATALMIESSSLVKRPVLSTANMTYVGYSDELYQQIFKK